MTSRSLIAELGLFIYAGQEVKLTAREDEAEFIVTTSRSETAETFENLGPAQNAFNAKVQEVIYYCSGSDLSLYMQQKADWFLPEPTTAPGALTAVEEWMERDPSDG